MPPGPGARIFDLRVDAPIGIAAGPLLNSRWVEAYARLGYGVLTYKTVRTSARHAFAHPNIVHCRLAETAVSEPTPRKLDASAVTWAISFGLPSAEPDEWRADVSRAKAKLRSGQALIVSVAGTPEPEGDAEQLADDYARCARWAAEAGADIIEAHLSSPHVAGEQAPMIYENPALSALILDRVRRAAGQRPLVAKIGSTRSPRALHELASRLAPRVDGFVLVNGVQRRVVKADGNPAFTGAGRTIAGIGGAAVFEHSLMQVEEMLAWRKAGAWNRAIFAVGGITTVERARVALAAGADLALVATAALTDPLIAAHFAMQHQAA